MKDNRSIPLRKDTYLWNKFLRGMCRRSRAFTSVVLKQIPICTLKESNDLLKEAIEAEKPFAAIRPGIGEIDYLIYQDERELWPPNGIRKRKSILRDKFVSEKEYDRYISELRDNMSAADAFFAFHSVDYDYIHSRYLSSIPVCRASALYTLGSEIINERKWTKALSGKKVLIVSIFSELINTQAEKMDKIFPQNNPWPKDIEFETVQSIWFPSYDLRDKRFGSYFDGLQYLMDQCMKTDFDVALLCCSSFGMDLAPMLKKAGKKAIQMGGDLQLLFGIKGRRWDDKSVSGLYNEHWVRQEKEKIGATEEISRFVDDGCYF